ncbi:MAG TPA: SBBP repeat-containing protein [Bacteroidales bacterium]
MKTLHDVLLRKILFFVLITGAMPVVFSQVVPEWVHVYNNPDNTSDKGRDVKLDVAGNVYVTGLGFSTFKFNPSGEVIWSNSHAGDAVAIAVDDDGNVYATGSIDAGFTRLDYATVKYSSQGAEQWFSTYGYINFDNPQDDYSSSIAVDHFGNVFVTGASEPAAWCDFATIKYGPGGDTLWVRRFGSWSDDKATAITVDEAGNVYVTGYTNNGPDRYNIGTIKYTPAGDTAWVRTYDGPGNDDDVPTDLAVDALGNIYVTGYSWGINNDFITLKYDASGALKWASRYNGPVNSHDKAQALAVDNDGNVYVTGESGGLEVNYDFTTIKYNANGQSQWVSRYSGPAALNDYATGLALDASGNVYVTGYSENAPEPYISSTDFATVKYDNNGNEIWSHRYNGPGNFHDKPAEIAVDKSGNVYVTGSSEYYDNYPNYFDCVTLKYANPNGIDDNDEVPFKIFPNPASVTFRVSGFGVQANIKRLEIIDVNGKMFKSFVGDYNSEGMEFDVSQLPSGLYFCRVYSENKIVTKKLLIQK